jgi:peptidoglycan/LPS O-acetylase OafA/YrhL
MRYMRQIDGLRALAVAMVFIDHFVGVRVPLGTMGVLLFFVISGFLITGILFDLKESVCEGLLSIPNALKLFYVRRFLRIFPLYYLCLLVLWLFNLPSVRQMIAWYVFYGINIRIAIDPNWSHFPATGHFWSLAVEEQFYLLWPLLILLLPKRHLRASLWGLVLVSLGFRAVERHFFHVNLVTSTILTVDCFDYFSLGALLALNDLRDKALLRIGGILSIPVLTFQILLFVLRRGISFPWTLFEFCCALIFTMLVSLAAEGSNNGFGRFLACKPMTYLGMISYGLYVYHLPIYNLMSKRTVPTVFLVLAIASLSWYLYEKPINGLKCHFNYPRHVKPQTSSRKLKKEVDDATVPVSGVGSYS